MIPNITRFFQNRRSKARGPIFVGIKWQLSLLACFSAICALGALAVATSIVNHSTVLGLRYDRLKVVAQLKAAQVTQILALLLGDVIVLGSRNIVYTLVSDYYRTFLPVDSASATDFQMMIQSTDNCVGGAVYSFNYVPIIYRTNNETLPGDVELPGSLFPLNGTIDPGDIATLSNGGSIVSGPIFLQDGFYLSITRSFSLQGPEGDSIPSGLIGYLTIASRATQLLDVVESTDLEDGSQMALIKLNGYTNITRSKITALDLQNASYTYVTPSLVCWDCYNDQFSLMLGSPEYLSLINGTAGAMISYQFPTFGVVSTGFAPVSTFSQIWGVIVFQPHKYVYGPITTIQNISITAVFSIGAGVCILTLLLSGWVLRPITRLQAATEQSYGDLHHSRGFWSPLRQILIYLPFGRKQRESQNQSAELTDNKSLTSPKHLDWFSRWQEDITEFKLPEEVVSRKYIRDELTELTETFNEMTSELRKQYQHLEDRVQERKKEIRKAKILAETGNEAKSLFIANITHELRTPLNGILGMASVAMEEKDPQSVRESLKVIFKSGELLLRLLTDLLSFSKSEVDNDNMKLEIKGFCMSEVILQLHAIFDESSKASKISFSISMTDEWLSQYELDGDVNRILQVVINLVSNSLKFTPPGGFVKVIISATKCENCVVSEQLHQTDKTSSDSEIGNEVSKLQPLIPITLEDHAMNFDGVIVSFTVCDSGAGIAPHLQSRVFEPFVQGEIGAKETRSGAGLGLSICRHLATLMNGTIDLQSEVGTGSCFTFTVPMEYRILSASESESYPGSEWHHGFDSPEHENETADMEFFGENDKKLPNSHIDGYFTSVLKPISGSNTQLASQDGIEEHHNPLFTEVPAQNNSGNNMTEVKGHLTKTANDGLMPSSHAGPSAEIKLTQATKSDGTALLTSSHGPSSTPLRAGSTHNASSASLNYGSAKKILDPELCSNLRVLIAEDNRVNQEVMLKMLRLEGITHVNVAKDGLEAVQAVRNCYLSSKVGNDKDVSDDVKSKTIDIDRKVFDVIFMDIQMPNLDGIQATEQIRRELGFSGAIIAVSAYADRSNVDRCRLAGMDDFLAKPIKRLQLHKMLFELLETQQRLSPKH